MRESVAVNDPDDHTDLTDRTIIVPEGYLNITREFTKNHFPPEESTDNENTVKINMANVAYVGTSIMKIGTNLYLHYKGRMHTFLNIKSFPFGNIVFARAVGQRFPDHLNL